MLGTSTVTTTHTPTPTIRVGGKILIFRGVIKGRDHLACPTNQINHPISRRLLLLRQPFHDQPSSMENLLREYMAKNDSIIRNQAEMLQFQAASLRNLENQVGQLTSTMKNRLQGTLSSDTENPRREEKEHCKAITL